MYFKRLGLVLSQSGGIVLEIGGIGVYVMIIPGDWCELEFASPCKSLLRSRSCDFPWSKLIWVMLWQVNVPCSIYTVSNSSNFPNVYDTLLIFAPSLYLLSISPGLKLNVAAEDSLDLRAYGIITLEIIWHVSDQASSIALSLSSRSVDCH